MVKSQDSSHMGRRQEGCVKIDEEQEVRDHHLVLKVVTEGM